MPQHSLCEFHTTPLIHWYLFTLLSIRPIGKYLLSVRPQSRHRSKQKCFLLPCSIKVRTETINKYTRYTLCQMMLGAKNNKTDYGKVGSSLVSKVILYKRKGLLYKHLCVHLWELRVKESGYLKEELSTLKEQQVQRLRRDSGPGLFPEEERQQ